MIDISEIPIALIKKKLNGSYLLGFNNKSYVIVFKPNKYGSLDKFLSKSSLTHEGCCYYFNGYSIALWDDLTDVIGFHDEHVCCLEIFQGNNITRDFYYRTRLS